ncbi:helicase-exonuclease AddAB subunit AddA [Suicoccus acidiformans]|uniref:DNA 3'-5' helicase n=2 Tax=Suicoccus acidiformans TaxID=2036206 RepID=A0A347WL66_9LACT|nr:helicase-exonuclease AddAB subunit AddA [Suicoccus acidiformans]
MMTAQIEPKPSNARFNDAQWQAIQERGHNILVAASAGSGKTTVLIERVLTHIRKGYANVNELLVVTFTELAANEMKERMETRLKQAVNQAGDAEERRHYVQQLDALPEAHIRTLHSFCLQVIQRYFYLIDLDPSLQLVSDETQKTLMYQEVWADLTEKIASDEHPMLSRAAYMDLLRSYGDVRNDQTLYDMVLALYQFAQATPEPAVWLANLNHIQKNFAHFQDSDLYERSIRQPLATMLASAQRLCEQTANIIEQTSQETIERYHDVLASDQGLLEHIDHLNKANDLTGLLKQAREIKFSNWPRNRKNSEDYEWVKVAKTYRDLLKELVDGFFQKHFTYDGESVAVIEAKLSEQLEDVKLLVAAFSEALRDYKQAQGQIDYNDLEHLTLDILAPYNPETKRREASQAARYYQDLFQEVLVDEYQDINEIQGEILNWLSQEYAAGSGNLFMVGDVKQSIYRFRMAEPSLFLERYQAYQQGDGGQLINLDQNYRSRHAILQFTNYLFERLMDARFGEMPYGELESLKTGNFGIGPREGDSQVAVQLLLGQKEDLANDETGALEPFDDSLEKEAHIIAQKIQACIAEGMEVYDKAKDLYRTIEYKDIVILSSTRSPFLTVQRVFEQYQIPILSQKIENYFQRHEIQLLLALLKIIDNPMQDIPYVAILRSYFVGLTDEALSQIRIFHKDGLFYEASIQFMQATHERADYQAIQDKLKTFHEQLNHWRALAKERPLVELIWTIYEETDFLNYVAGLSNGTQRQANLHAFYERAKTFTLSRFSGLQGFIHYIEEVMEQSKDLAEPVLLEEDNSAVRLMTVHASKGLEFPVVFLMNMGKQFNLQDINQKRYIASKDYGLGTSYYDARRYLRFDSLTHQAIKQVELDKAKAEEMRKLYVALTRCEQILFMVGTIKNQTNWEEEQGRIQQMYEGDDLLIPLTERQKGMSWLDWLQGAMALANDAHPKSHADFKQEELAITFVDTAILEANLPIIDGSQTERRQAWQAQFKQQLLRQEVDQTAEVQNLAYRWQQAYPYELASRTSSYQSVSELKRMYEEPRIEKLDYYTDRRPSQTAAQEVSEADASIQSIRYTGDTFQPPKFMQEAKVQLNAAEIGTIHHFFMQALDFGLFKGVSPQDYLAILQEANERMQAEGHLTAQEGAVLNLESIVAFLESNLGQVVINRHQHLHREKAFSYLLPAAKMFERAVLPEQVEALKDNQLLVHGVIDMYFEKEDGTLLLLDYKTNRFRSGARSTRSEQLEILTEQYRFQLSLYQAALESAKQKEVSESYLVFLDFKEQIPVETIRL